MQFYQNAQADGCSCFEHPGFENVVPVQLNAKQRSWVKAIAITLRAPIFHAWIHWLHWPAAPGSLHLSPMALLNSSPPSLDRAACYHAGFYAGHLRVRRRCAQCASQRETERQGRNLRLRLDKL